MFIAIARWSYMNSSSVSKVAAGNVAVINLATVPLCPTVLFLPIPYDTGSYCIIQAPRYAYIPMPNDRGFTALSVTENP